MMGGRQRGSKQLRTFLRRSKDAARWGGIIRVDLSCNGDLFVVDPTPVATVDRTSRQPAASFERSNSVSLALPSGRIIPIGHDQTLIVGSDPRADLPFSDCYVSFRHAAIRREGLGFHVEDLRSTNGTYVDGVRIEQAWAGPGSRIRIGNQRLEVTGEGPSGPDALMLGQSPRFRTIKRYLRLLAKVRPPVLICGETGTGKELAAQALHEWGPRRPGPFVAINCAALSETLLESTLFGHVRGAFTGAHRDRAGAFVDADGGTLFLDEVGELLPHQQAKLLRVLELGQVAPVGTTHTRPVDVRVVSATHRNLAGMVTRGAFREDLFHRLSVLQLGLPPLRERREDIPVLLQHFARIASEELGRRIVVSQAAVEAAKCHPWPGNIRALRNAVIRAATLADGPIGAAELTAAVPEAPGRAGEPGHSSALDADAALTPPSPRPPRGSVQIPHGDYKTMRRQMLSQIVEEHGSIRKAATILRIPRSTLGAWLR